MKNEKPVLGMIDCPHCGEVNGMAVKADKNNEPFGHCEDCAGQLRVGGKPGRVRKFLRLHPELVAAFRAAPVEESATVGWAAPVTAPAVQAAPVTAKPAPEIPVTVTEAAPSKPAKRAPSWMDALASLAVAGQVTA